MIESHDAIAPTLADHGSRITHHESSPLAVLFRVMALMLSPIALSGCYLMQAATGQLAISTSREPFDKVIANPSTTEATQKRLRLVAEAREFASKELSLPDNKSYRTYVELNREYAVWNVFATERYSVDAKQWCFPIAGCVVYRGYFKEEAAQKYARRQRLNGGDATVSGVAAYSTLGHLNDPVLSSMFKWSDAQIVATLFHELAHQVYYVADESAFNEGFASVVEDEGLRRWEERHPDQTPLAIRQSARERSAAFTRLLLTTRDRLRDLYAKERPSFDLYIRKQQEFGRLKYEYSLLKASWNGYTGYDYWFNRALNNADLVSAATYESCAPGLERMLREQGSDLPKFYGAAKRLSRDERKKLCAQRPSMKNPLR